MPYLFDSDIVIDLLDGVPHIRETVNSLLPAGAGISIVTYYGGYAWDPRTWQQAGRSSSIRSVHPGGSDSPILSIRCEPMRRSASGTSTARQISPEKVPRLDSCSHGDQLRLHTRD